MKESAYCLFSQMNSAWGACTNLYWGETYPDGDIPDVLRFIFHSNHLIKTNKISKVKLESLSGRGSAIAQRIIDSRPFYSKGSLKSVKGIRG